MPKMPGLLAPSADFRQSDSMLPRTIPTAPSVQAAEFQMTQVSDVWLKGQAHTLGTTQTSGQAKETAAEVCREVQGWRVWTLLQACMEACFSYWWPLATTAGNSLPSANAVYFHIQSVQRHPSVGALPRTSLQTPAGQRCVCVRHLLPAAVPP